MLHMLQSTQPAQDIEESHHETPTKSRMGKSQAGGRNASYGCWHNCSIHEDYRHLHQEAVPCGALCMSMFKAASNSGPRGAAVNVGRKAGSSTSSQGRGPTLQYPRPEPPNSDTSYSAALTPVKDKLGCCMHWASHGPSLARSSSVSQHV